MKICKITVFICMIICCFTMLPTNIFAETEVEEQPIDDTLLEAISLDEITSFWNNISQEYGDFLPELTEKNLNDLIKEHGTISVKSILKGIIKFLFYELVVNGKLLGTLMIITIFSVILQSMHTAFENSVVSKIAYFVVYLVLIYITLNSFYLVFTYAKESIETMSSFMIALLPLLIVLIATFGQVITISFFHPIILFLIHISGVLTSTFIFPLLYLSALLIIVSQLNENFKATYLADLMRTVSLSTLGMFFTIFLGVMSVQGTATAIQDGVALKTTRFITGNFIPVIGRTLTDAADTFLSAAMLLKNAIGIVGLIIIVIIAIFPALKIMVIAFIYKLAAAILQPLGNSPVIVTLNTISKYMMYVLSCLIIVTFMFFLSIVIITVASNIPLLMR